MGLSNKVDPSLSITVASHFPARLSAGLFTICLNIQFDMGNLSLEGSVCLASDDYYDQDQYYHKYKTYRLAE